jgi:signal transduction histidine kinase/ABC-type amino acid transport substrate-binding protein
MKKMETTGLFGKIILFLFILSWISGGVLPSAQAAKSNAHRTVKVAVLNNSTYADQDKNGVWSGMDVECMISVAQKAGFSVEFLDSSNDPDFLGNLDNGTYDIVADVVNTPEREKQYLFTDEVMGSINNTLAVRASDNRWDYGNIDQISDMKVGVLSSYANNADFRTWCGKHQIQPEIIEYENIDEMTAALQNGEIDGGVYSATGGENYTRDFRTILKFLPESYGFAFRKTDVELKNEVDTAIAQILSVNIDYLTNLKNKYETQFKNNILPLSSAETNYISRNPVVTVAVVADDAPYYEKASDRSDAGIIPDYYNLLADWTGFRFRYAVYKTYQEMIAAVQSGEADVIGMYSNGPISAYQNGLALTNSISTVSCILLTNPGTDVNKVGSVATITKTTGALQIGFNRLFPDAGLQEYKNAQNCFGAVKKGKADAALVGLYTATWLINQTNSTSYSIIPVSGITYEICAAVQENDQTLCAILNKGIAATKGNFTGITTKDTMPQNNLKTTISRIPPVVAATAVCVLLSLVVVLAWAIVMLRRRQRERTAVLAAQAETEKEKNRVEEMQKNTEARNRFFANISHDMRTPLNAILGFAALAEKDDANEAKRKEYISKIRISGTLLLDLINDTLTISKANSGKLELKPQPVRARDLFESIIVPLRQSAAKKNITFTADYAGVLDRTVMIDELSFQKILLNLLSNAVKYTPEGGHVSIRLYDDPPESRTPDLIIVVSDDGIGISPEFLPHVFEPFTQEKRRGYESVGTGLGLSIVKQLVELMGGTIQVQSEKGVGSTFTVRLHFEEAASGIARKTKGSSTLRPNVSGKKVLLCEDNVLNREIAVALLQGAEISADVAQDGQEGVQMFASSGVGEYYAILMDVRMPIMNGYEAAKAIRAMDRQDAKTIPIIAMTADAFEEDIQKCLEAGMNVHIAKPFDPETLYRVLAEFADP